MQDSSSNFPDDYYKYDAQHYKKFLQSYAEDLRTSYNRSLRSVVENLSFKGNIVIVGSSWSLNAARVVGDYLQGKVRLLFAQDYEDSLKLSSDDVVIAISYSGDSEEAASWLKIARRVGCKSIIIASGGRLVEDSFNSPIIDLTKNLPSKCASFTIIGSLLRLFEDAGLIESQMQ